MSSSSASSCWRRLRCCCSRCSGCCRQCCFGRRLHSSGPGASCCSCFFFSFWKREREERRSASASCKACRAQRFLFCFFSFFHRRFSNNRNRSHSLCFSRSLPYCTFRHSSHAPASQRRDLSSVSRRHGVVQQSTSREYEDQCALSSSSLSFVAVAVATADDSRCSSASGVGDLRGSCSERFRLSRGLGQGRHSPLVARHGREKNEGERDRKKNASK